MEFDEERAALEEQFGPPRGMAGQWAACLRIVDPASLSTVHVVELDENETVTSMCLAPLQMTSSSASSSSSGAGADTYLVVGTAQALKFFPTDADGGCGDGWLPGGAAGSTCASAWRGGGAGGHNGVRCMPAN